MVFQQMMTDRDVGKSGITSSETGLPYPRQSEVGSEEHGFRVPFSEYSVCAEHSIRRSSRNQAIGGRWKIPKAHRADGQSFISDPDPPGQTYWGFGTQSPFENHVTGADPWFTTAGDALCSPRVFVVARWGSKTTTTSSLLLQERRYLWIVGFAWAHCQVQ